MEILFIFRDLIIHPVSVLQKIVQRPNLRSALAVFIAMSILRALFKPLNNSQTLWVDFLTQHNVLLPTRMAIVLTAVGITLMLAIIFTVSAYLFGARESFIPFLSMVLFISTTWMLIGWIQSHTFHRAMEIWYGVLLFLAVKEAYSLTWLKTLGSCSLAALFVIFCTRPFTSYISDQSSNQAKNCYTIKNYLQPDSNFPYIGFWKENCGDNFGFAIDRTADGKYSISFCGPGSCSEPGTYRPNTSLINDPEYRLIDGNTIDILTKKGFKRQYRCP